jgi:hypothetical protein
MVFLLFFRVRNWYGIFRTRYPDSMPGFGFPVKNCFLGEWQWIKAKGQTGKMKIIMIYLFSRPSWLYHRQFLMGDPKNAKISGKKYGYASNIRKFRKVKKIDKKSIIEKNRLFPNCFFLSDSIFFCHFLAKFYDHSSFQSHFMKKNPDQQPMGVRKVGKLIFPNPHMLYIKSCALLCWLRIN